ncbi:MAG: hypothetical protein KAJ03_04090 [Gammaproteobacteria bacterium]|nr:hypothetical protein [Gammaproteobacteria bacterium]
MSKKNYQEMITHFGSGIEYWYVPYAVEEFIQGERGATYEPASTPCRAVVCDLAKRTIITYCEGDVITLHCYTEPRYHKELKRMKEWYRRENEAADEEEEQVQALYTIEDVSRLKKGDIVVSPSGRNAVVTDVEEDLATAVASYKIASGTAAWRVMRPKKP